MSAISKTATQVALEKLMEDNKVRADAELQKRQLERAYQNLQSQLNQPGSLQPQMGGLMGQKPLPGNYRYGTSPFTPEEDVREDDQVFRKEVTIEEAKRLLVPLLQTSIVPFLWGPPGVGKSQIISQICQEQDWELIDLRLSLLNPVDLRGLPVINHKEHRADWYHPSFLPNGHNRKKGILFLDEINLAPLSVQAAAYQLILDKKIGDYTFPSEWMMIAAGNRTSDRANVYKISAPLANRFAHFTIVPDFATWRRWAVGAGIRSEIIDFLIVRPVQLFQMPREGDQAFPTPRSWAFLSHLLDAYGLGEGVTREIEHVVRGTIGDAVGEEFVRHLRDYNLKDIGAQIEKFIQTGKITLPKDATAKRFAILQAILDAHLSGRINQTAYKAFLKKLSGEESATLEAEQQKRLAPLESFDGKSTFDEVPF